MIGFLNKFEICWVVRSFGVWRWVDVYEVCVGDINLYYLSKYRCRKCIDVGFWREMGIEDKGIMKIIKRSDFVFFRFLVVLFVFIII